MSNPLDSLTPTLKTIEPNAQAIENTIAALDGPHPSRLVPLAVGVAALSAVALWPRPGNGLAWAQIAAQSLPPRTILRIESFKGGRFVPSISVWEDRFARSSRVRFAPLPGLNFDYESIRTPQGFYAQIRKGYAVFSRHPRPGTTPFDGLFDLKDLFKEEGTRQLSVERGVETRVGRADQYRISQIPTDHDQNRGDVEIGRRENIVYVLSGTSRVLGWDAFDSRSQPSSRTTIEYPDHFDALAFAVPHHSNVRLYDLDEERAHVRVILAKPLGKATIDGQSIALRLVVQAYDKSLAVLWTGTPPNGDLAQKARVIGKEHAEVYGLASLTSKGDRGYRSPFGGHSIKLDTRRDHVDLTIPVFAPGIQSRFVGTTTFRDVPVLQVDSLYSLDDELHLQKSVRPIGSPFSAAGGRSR